MEQQMSELRLHGMSQSWQALQETRRHNELSLSEGLEILFKQKSWTEKTGVLND